MPAPNEERLHYPAPRGGEVKSHAIAVCWMVMIHLTSYAVLKLKALILEHPDDPVVRIDLKDINQERLMFSITLEDRLQSDDLVQDCEGLTVAINSESAPRLDGVTVDYREPDGFSFQHPRDEENELFGY